MKDKKKKREVQNALVQVLQFSINIIVPIAVCIFVSYLVAQKTGNRNIIIVGILVGIVAGVNGAYNQIKHFLKKEESPGQRARRLEEENQDDKLD